MAAATLTAVATLTATPIGLPAAATFTATGSLTATVSPGFTAPATFTLQAALAADRVIRNITVSVGAPTRAGIPFFGPPSS